MSNFIGSVQIRSSFEKLAMDYLKEHVNDLLDLYNGQQDTATPSTTEDEK